ncbi:hypothetical protein GWI33_002344 [Rhynchophorus ferrugineus]|uniref:HAT C-terminal dimerisation domain-containing protein n=1 Tax=Rhynchophorus ferrugineus TaxID=354439 RepID=A0A834HXL5_RHYFE|nr:hypothetical protein GWI33_002344 [Rhynchophorus ferrugineus]
MAPPKPSNNVGKRQLVGQGPNRGPPKKHRRDSVVDLEEPSTSKATTKVQSARASKNPPKYTTEDLALLYFGCKDQRLFETVENEGFLQFMKLVAPNFKIPSASFLKEMLLEKYRNHTRDYQSKLSRASDICITLNMWTEVNNRSFLKVVAHFIENHSFVSCTIAVREFSKDNIPNYIAQNFREILNSWNINHNQIRAVVTDNNRPNITTAIKSTMGEKLHLPCFVGKINIIINDVLSNRLIKRTINKVKDIITWVENSTIRSNKLRNLQLQNNVPEESVLQLVLNDRTKWTTTYYMLEIFSKLWQVIYEIILEYNRESTWLSSNEIEVVKELVQLLKPFECMIREACQQKYVTISKILPLISCLSSELNNVNIKLLDMIVIKETLITTIKQKFESIEFNDHVAISTLLDPRFKNLHFLKPEARQKAISKLREKIRLQNTDNASNWCEQNKKYDFWKHHKKLANVDEVSQYLSRDVANLQSNPLVEWEKMRSVFPRLYNVARSYLVVVANSAPCRLSSPKPGKTPGETTDNLSNEDVEKLLFLRSLSDDEFFSDIM